MSIYFGIVGQQQGYVFKYDNHIIFMYHMILCYCIYLTSISSTEWLKTTPSIHLWGSVIIVLDTTPRDLPKPMQIWGRCLGGPCSWRALRGQDLHWSIRWLGQGYRNEGRMVSARDRSIGLLWVYTVEWAKLVYFPGEKHDFFRKYMVSTLFFV